MRALLLLLALVSAAGAQSLSPTEQLISLEKFDQCGFISRFAPNKIEPQCFQYLANVVLDQDYSILRRNGYAAYNATPCTGSQPIRGMWPFFATDGSQYIIFQSSSSMFYSKGDGTCSAIPGLSGLSSSLQMSCVQGMGYLWCTDSADSVFQTNVTSTATVPQAPLGKYIGFFRNRFLISGVSGFLTNIYMSGELNGQDYTLPAVQVTTSPAIINISGTNDGEGVSCLMGEYQNGYYIGRNYDTYQLSGYDLRDFTVRKVDQQIGCMDNNSVQMVNNTLMWLSHRGIESLSGTQINWASFPIDPTIQVVISAAGNSQAQTINNTNFTSGNLTASGAGAPISATISPNNLVPSSSTNRDSTFTGSYSSAAIINGSLQISTGSPFFNAGFENNSFLNWTNSNWGIVGATGFSCDRNYAICTGNCNPNTGGANGGVIGQRLGNIPITVEAYAYGGTLLYSSTTWRAASQACTSTPINVNLSTQSSPGGVYVHVFATNYSSYSVISSTFPSWSNGFQYGLQANCVLGGNNNCSGVFDIIESTYGASFASATFVDSTIYDTNFSTPILGTSASIQSTSVSGTSVTYSITYASSTTGIFGTSPKEFFKYSATFNQSNSTQVAYISTAVFVAETTGYYISPCISVSSPTSWGVFNVNAVTNGGSFSFAISTGATCAIATAVNANWTAQTANSVITVATTTTDVAVRVLFSLDASSQVPTLNNMTVNWNSGGARPPVSATQYKNRYYMFYTTSTAPGAANDHAVIFDQNAHWQLFDDIHAASSALYLNQLFLGDSNATGTSYIFDSGQTDAGNAFTFGFTTPDLDGGDPVSPKNFSRMYMLLGAPSATTAASALTCSYAINGSTTSYPLSTVTLSEAPESSGYFVAKFPFDSSLPTAANWLNISCNNTGSQGPLRIYGIRLVYTKNDWP